VSFFSFWIELVCLHHRGDNSPVRVDEFFEIEKSPRDVVDVLPVSVTPWCRYAAHSAILPGVRCSRLGISDRRLAESVSILSPAYLAGSEFLTDAI